MLGDNSCVTTKVDFYFDPICPWAWMASRWMLEVEKVRDIELRFKPMSLASLNEDRDLPENYRADMDEAWKPMRVVFAVREAAGDAAMRDFYTALGTRIHVQERGWKDPQVLGEALAELGLDPALAEEVASTRFDDEIRSTQKAVIELVGDEVGTPVITVDGASFFGPVISPAPKGEEAGTLFDGVSAAAAYPGFFELKRSRTVGPIFD